MSSTVPPPLKCHGSVRSAGRIGKPVSSSCVGAEVPVPRPALPRRAAEVDRLRVCVLEEARKRLHVRDQVGPVLLAQLLAPARHRRAGHAVVDDREQVRVRRQLAARGRSDLVQPEREVARPRQHVAGCRAGALAVDTVTAGAPLVVHGLAGVGLVLASRPGRQYGRGEQGSAGQRTERSEAQAQAEAEGRIRDPVRVGFRGQRASALRLSLSLRLCPCRDAQPSLTANASHQCSPSAPASSHVRGCQPVCS
jgi:hypothetical protein